MLANIVNTHGQTNDSEIINFEKKHRIKLPDSYKKFLNEFNGGIPEEYVIDFLDTGGNVKKIFGITEDLVFSIEVFWSVAQGEYLPDGLIRIATTPNGDHFLLSSREDSYGFVYYYQHDYFDHDSGDLYEFDPKNGIVGAAITK